MTGHRVRIHPLDSAVARIAGGRGIGIVVSLTGVVLLAVFLIVRYRLGLVRFFDADEMAYLYWGRHVAAGAVPYRDFFFYAMPGFLTVVASAVGRLAPGTAVLDGGRVLAWATFVLLTGSVGLLSWALRRSAVAAVAAMLLLAFLPLPEDKFLELRPDTLSMALVVLGMALQVWWMGDDAGRPGSAAQPPRVPRIFIYGLTGLLYGMGMYVFTKAVPAAAVAAVLAVGWSTVHTGGRGWKKIAAMVRELVPLGAGMAVLPLGLLVWAAVTGRFDWVWYTLVKFPMEANKLALLFYVAPGQFFFPNDVYYGVWGEHLGFILNQAVWLVGMAWAAYRLVAPFVPGGRRMAPGWLLTAGMLAVQVYLFVSVVPVRHAQYLIPLATLVVLFAGDAVASLWTSVRGTAAARMAFLAGWLGLLALLYRGFWIVNTPKFTWTNNDTKAMVNRMVTTIPTNTYILDLVGLAMDYPSPSYVSCLPIGQYAQLASRKFPPVAADLERLSVPYIYQGLLMRVIALEPRDQSYINANYHAVGNGELLVRNGIPVPPGL
jgi:hypothetical protein